MRQRVIPQQRRPTRVGHRHDAVHNATVTVAHSDEQLAEGNFKGHHPLIGVCDNTGGEPLAWMLRRGSAGSNTAADHTAVTDAAIAALPPGFRRKLMITVVIRVSLDAVRCGR